MTKNPLESLFRHKAVYTSLPSNGRFYPSGIKLSVDNEIGIMPMSAADEIKLKTPDSLFNGEALFDLFKSCVPDIVNPEEIPICDVDKLLIGIRVATQGKNIDINSICPKCNHKETYVVDLTRIMASAQEIVKDNILHLNGAVSIDLKPLTIKNQIKSQIVAFYQYKMQQMLLDNETPEERKLQVFNEALVNAIAIQTTQVADAIQKVTMTQGEETIEVVDPEHILGWVKNMDAITHTAIKDFITTLNDPKIDDKVRIKCVKCEHEYKVDVELNPVNFF